MFYVSKCVTWSFSRLRAFLLIVYSSVDFLYFSLFGFSIILHLVSLIELSPIAFVFVIHFSSYTISFYRPAKSCSISSVPSLGVLYLFLYGAAVLSVSAFLECVYNRDVCVHCIHCGWLGQLTSDWSLIFVSLYWRQLLCVSLCVSCDVYVGG